ncbi:hypothetical protein [Flavobacterium branchiophilum]|uniref:Uncharacterized protein n=1 Tax=Flavobacterium branchiophilum TaxID=55197 RepID=A0A2H3K8Y7_9FLAO|nr:hypothetical protein [Flavobacterium branchiophilum]PDS22357.1 hypothetical protein B0A77_13655 [Flavobacterium branchiophilum]
MELIEEKIEMAPELLSDVQIDVEKQVIVHCHARYLPNMPWQLRVWPTIYLFPKESNHRCKLIQHFNIALYPQWLYINMVEHNFTLVFEGLPKGCMSFDILEIIPESGAFEAFDIQRNSTDVYHVNFF